MIFSAVFAGVFFCGEAVGAAEPPESDASPSYYHDVRPVFQAHCQGCHQPAKSSGEYVMTSFDKLIRGGESGDAAIVPGQPDDSYLVALIRTEDGEAEMPQGQPPLAEKDFDTIVAWIRAGAIDDTPAGARTAYDMDHPPSYRSLPIITALDYSPDGQLLAVSGYHEVLVHSGDGSQLVARLVGLAERIESIAFSPDGQRLAVTGGQPARMGEVQIWDVSSYELRLSVPVTYDTIFGASWSPDNKYVAFGCTDNSVRAINAETGEQVLLQRAPNDWTLDTVFSVDGSHVVSTGRDMAVKLTHFETERFIDNITSITPGALKGGLLAIARHPQRDEVLVVGDDGVPRAYRVFRETKRVIGDDGNLVRRFPPMPGRIFDVAYSRGGTRLVAGSSLDGMGFVHVYSCGYEFELPKDIANIKTKVGTSRNADEKKKIEEYHTKDVGVVAEMKGQRGSIYAVAYKPDGQIIASAGYDGIVRLNDPETGKLLREFTPVPLGNDGNDP